MKTFEKILIGLILIGLTMKFLFLPWAGLILALSIGGLAFLYMPFGIFLFNNIPLKKIFRTETYKGTSPIEIGKCLGLGYGLSMLLIGILFKIQHLPGTPLILMIGLLITLVFIILFLIQYIKSKNRQFFPVLWRAVVIGCFGILLFLTPSSTITKIQYRNHPQYIEAYENYLKDPKNEELQENLKIERSRIYLSKEEFEASLNEEHVANQE